MRRLGRVFLSACLLWGLGLFVAGSGLADAVPEYFLLQAEAAVEVKPTPQLPQAVVRENFIQQATKAIQETMAERGDNRRYTIQAVNVPAGLRMPWGKVTYSYYLPNGIRKGLNTAVHINVLVDGRYYATMKCVMKVRIYENVVTAARRIQHEVPLRAEDLRIEEKEDKGQAYQRYTDINELLGKVLTSNIGEGTVLHSGLVREPILIRPYAVVNICTVFNGVEIKVSGTALETGRRGAYISVRNDSSGRKVRAKVIDENNVMVMQ